MVRTGQADIVYNLDPAAVSMLRTDSNVNVISDRIPRTTLVKLNSGHPILSDVKVRQALSLAIDRKGIASGVMRISNISADQLFGPKKIKELEPEIEQLAYKLIKSFLPDGHCDWVEQFSIPFPLMIIGRQMGIKNEEDLWKIKRASSAFFQRISMMLSEEEELEAIEKEIEAQHYFQPIFEELRKHPDDTLLSELVLSLIHI